MKARTNNKQEPAEAATESFSWSKSPDAPVSEGMSTDMWAWLCKQFEAELQDTQAKVEAATARRLEAERLNGEVYAALKEAPKAEGRLTGPKIVEARAACNRAARELVKAREVELLRRSKVKECVNRLRRARAGIAPAQEVIVESWDKRYSYHIMGPVKPVVLTPPVDEIQKARNAPGSSLTRTQRGPLSGAVNRGLGRAT